MKLPEVQGGSDTTSYPFINQRTFCRLCYKKNMSAEEGSAQSRILFDSEFHMSQNVSECNNLCERTHLTTSHRMLTHWQSFGCRTTIHGISHIYQTENKRKRQIWFWLTLVGFSMTGIHLYFHTTNFLASPITTVIKHQEENFIFPDVTFCSLTPTSETYYMRLPNTTNHRLGLTQSDLLTLGSRWSTEDIERMSKNADEDVLLHRKVFYYQRNSYSDFERSYYPYNEMIMRCTYFGEKCKAEDFVLLRDPYYWNCYIFRPKRRNVTSTTPHEGLNVILYTGTTVIQQFSSGSQAEWEKQELTKTINEETLKAKLNVHSGFLGADFYTRVLLPEQEPTGVKVTIHEAFTHPHPRSQGFVIGNGLYAKIGLEMTSEKKMNRKNQKCFDNPKLIQLRAQINYDGEIQTVPYLYDNEACVALHTQKYVIDKCKCSSHFLPIQHLASEEICYNYTQYIKDLLAANNLTYDDLPVWNIRDGKKSAHQYRELGNVLAKSAKGRMVAQNHFLREKCHDELIENIFTNITKKIEKECQSHEICISKRYSYFYSTAPYPRDYGLAEMVQNIILPNVRDKETGLFKSIAYGIFNITGTDWSTKEELIRQNFLKIVIHPLSIKSDVHQEEFTYNIWEALSELGGITGLWLGISCLTIFEIFDLMIDMLGAFKKKKTLKQRRNKNKRDADNNFSASREPLKISSGDSNVALLAVSKVTDSTESHR